MKNSQSKSAYYLFLTMLAVAMIGLGIYSIGCGGVLNVVLGVLCLIIGYIIGLSLYGDNWGSWF